MRNERCAQCGEPLLLHQQCVVRGEHGIARVTLAVLLDQSTLQSPVGFKKGVQAILVHVVEVSTLSELTTFETWPWTPCNCSWALALSSSAANYPFSPHLLPNQPQPPHRDKLHEDHHHQITKSSHSINAIGPAPHRGGRKRGTAPLCLQLLHTSQACTRYAENASVDPTCNCSGALAL
jgi:hypothetical protein